ncbi:phospholipase [Sediminicola sp. YIK13]|uniref:alpha/beta hydrolase n=1 Tax=Sediminicola sp. YIK13 TaxID=1453352 RepID=UPI00071F920B|nr:alpha/beta fold hydrolase [Sediminicola sp. YIK13]ALM07194.1 phospholipase [Sediminicola sp. YIK13]
MTTAPLSLHHIIRPSSLKTGKPPVMFMFHGYGSNEEDLFSFANELPEELCIISVRAPYPLPPYGNAWYAINFDDINGKWSDEEQAVIAREKIVKFMDEACATYHLDDKRITLLGFSQGTILSYAVALSYPEKVKNVVALSGYINENLLTKDHKNKDHKNLKIYASHGMVDQVIPPEWAQKAPKILESLGVEHKYEEFPVGHGVAPQNFYSFKKWLGNKI